MNADTTYKPIFTNRFMNWVRSKFTRTRKPRLSDVQWIVPVYLEHPDVPGQVVKQYVTITARTKSHARVRLRKELRLRIGTAKRF